MKDQENIKKINDRNPFIFIMINDFSFIVIDWFIFKSSSIHSSNLLQYILQIFFNTFFKSPSIHSSNLCFLKYIFQLYCYKCIHLDNHHYQKVYKNLWVHTFCNVSRFLTFVQNCKKFEFTLLSLVWISYIFHQLCIFCHFDKF